MEIKVLDTGCCSKGQTTVTLIEQTAREKGVAITLKHIQDLKEIMANGVMSTPGVVIDGKLVHSGGVPSKDKVAAWFG